MTFNKHVIQFYENLNWHSITGFEEITPLLPLAGTNRQDVHRILQEFYNKFYHDTKVRRMIIGINPGRLGAGSTGVPFTDTMRLKEHCNIEPGELKTHEPSSVFMYKMIEAFGGVELFYQQFYITSVCPIGFTKLNQHGTQLNWNYYDDKQFALAIEPYISDQMNLQLSFGIDQQKAFCLGTGQNFKHLVSLNQKYRWFGQIIPLEHPRYVMQYKFKNLDFYIQKYLLQLMA